MSRSIQVGPNPSLIPFSQVSLSMGSVTLGAHESHRLVVQDDGALDNINNHSPATFLLGPAATSMRVVEDYTYPYPSLLTESREAGVMIGVIVPSTSTNWETDGLASNVVNFSSVSAVTASSLFAISAASGALVWGSNYLVRDYTFNDSTLTGFVNQGIYAIEIDMQCSNYSTSGSGLSANIYFPNGRTTFTLTGDAGGATGWCPYLSHTITPDANPDPNPVFPFNRVPSHHWDVSFASCYGAAEVALLVGRRSPYTGLNSQFVQFYSGASGVHVGKMYAASDGTFIIFPNTETTSIPLAIFGDGTVSDAVFKASAGFQIGNAGITATVIDAGTNIFGASLSIVPRVWDPLVVRSLGDEVFDGVNVQICSQAGTSAASTPTWNGLGVGSVTTESTGVKWRNLGTPVASDNGRNFAGNSYTIVSPSSGLRTVVVDSALNANLQQVTINSIITIDASRNTNFAFVTSVGIIVNGASGGAGVGYVNVSNGYRVNGFTVVDAGVNLAGNSLTCSVVSCSTLFVTTFSPAIVNASVAIQISGSNVFDGSRDCYANSYSVGPYGAAQVVVNSSRQATFSALAVGGTSTFTGNTFFNGVGFSVNANHINSNDYYCGSVPIIDSSRNLSNIGSISMTSNISCAGLTSSNHISTNGVARFVCQGNIGGTDSWVDSAGKTITYIGGLFIRRV